MNLLRCIPLQEIVGLQGRRPARARSLAQARPEIERRLLPARKREVVEAWLAEEKKKSKSEVFLCPDKSAL